MLTRIQYFMKRASRIVRKAKVSLGLIKLRSILFLKKGEIARTRKIKNMQMFAQEITYR